MTFDDAHKRVDAWLTEEGRRGLKGEAETDATQRRAIETVLAAALDKEEASLATPYHYQYSSRCMLCVQNQPHFAVEHEAELKEVRDVPSED